MKDLKRLFRFALPHRQYFILAFVFCVVETVFELIIPMIMADILDVGVVNHDVNYILRQGALMIFCALLSLITGLLFAKNSAKATTAFGAELRKAEFRKIQEYSFANLDHFETSSLITRLTSDVTVMQNAITGGMRPFIR